MMPAIEIVSGVGGYMLYKRLKNIFPSRLVSLTYVFVITISFVLPLQAYFMKQRTDQAKAMIYGVKDAISALHAFNYVSDQFIITT